MSDVANDHILNLNYLLKKDPIIPTFSSEQLEKVPQDVQSSYGVHAKTHIPLGDTSEYVDKIITWVGGQNKGAFIGGVLGDYGEGKTSFMVHIWDQCNEQGVMAVPPFSWRSQNDIITGIHGWLMFKLEHRPEEALQAKRVFTKYREKDLEQAAKEAAKKTDMLFDEVYRLIQSGGLDINLETNNEDVLNYCAEVSEVVVKAGYEGLLVQLDEPEVAARGSDKSTREIGQILFDFANGLLNRNGNYGIFISMPKNFLTEVSRAFSSLVDRLQGRKCFPSLSTFYHDNFARELWERYAETLEFTDIKNAIITPQALHAVGQITSSKRRDLSRGPRSVISVFRRALEHYQDENNAYTPWQLVEDCADQEIIVSNDYRTRIAEVLSNQQAEEIGKDTLQVLCAFPDGVKDDMLTSLGIDTQALHQHIRPGNPLLYHNAGYVGLRPLRPSGEATQGVLEDAIQDIMSEYAPRPRTFKVALEAFASEVLPDIFKKREGRAITNWDYGELEKLSEGEVTCYRLELNGTFQGTTDYPYRKVHLVLSDDTFATDDLRDQYNDDSPDVLMHLCLHWHTDLPQERVALDKGNPEEFQPALIQLDVDAAHQAVTNTPLSKYVEDESLLTPMALLYLLGEVQKLSLPRQESAIWDSIRKSLPAKIVTLLFGDEGLRQQLAQVDSDLKIPGAAADLPMVLFRFVMKQRFPNYHTLMVQTNWKDKIQDYTNAISNANIPLAARRGLEPWVAPKDEVARAFGRSSMNFDAWVSDLGTLITTKKVDRDIEVRFKLHPVEEEIQQAIMAQEQERRIKLDGVEVWSMPQGDILPLVLRSGYHFDELREIVAIGTSRGSFEADDYKGRPYLYVRPLNPEQLRAKLTEKLEALRTQVEGFKQIPTYREDVNLEGLEQSIADVQDEVQFEAVQNTLNRAFEKDNARLDNYFSELADKVEWVQRSLGEDKNSLRNRSVTNLKTSDINASSSWVSAYKERVIANLLENLKVLERKYDALAAQAMHIKEEYTDKRGGTPDVKVQRIVEGWRQFQELKLDEGALSDDIKRFVRNTQDNEDWQTLLRKSDALYNSLLEEQQQGSSQVEQFLQELKVLWEDIENHLDRRGIDGLESHKQFTEQLEDLNKRYREYLNNLKAKFENEKRHANDVLQKLGISRINEPFNPSDLEGCYERLYDALVQTVKSKLEVEIKAINDELRELRYEHLVLGRIPNEQFTAHEEGLHKAQQAALSFVLNELDKSALRASLQEEDASLANIDVVIQAAIDAVRESKQLRKQQPIPPSAELNQSAQTVEGFLEGARSKDLKAVILELMDDKQPAEAILDMSLEALVELFRAGRVNVKIEPTSGR
jgi:hypothetical protein